MNDATPYLDEVIQAHEAIERWFAVEEDDAALQRLLARFSPRFSMVTPLGRGAGYRCLAPAVPSRRRAEERFQNPAQ